MMTPKELTEKVLSAETLDEVYEIVRPFTERDATEAAKELYSVVVYASPKIRHLVAAALMTDLELEDV